MAPAKSKGPVPSIPSSVRTRHPVLGAQPASHSLYNACSQGERQTFCPKPQPPQGRVLPARDSSQEKNHPKGVQLSPRQIFPYQHTRIGVKQQHQSYRGRAWQLQDPCRTIPLLGWLSIPNIAMGRMFPSLPARTRSFRSPAFMLVPTIPAASFQHWKGEHASAWLLPQWSPVHHQGF